MNWLKRLIGASAQPDRATAPEAGPEPDPSAMRKHQELTPIRVAAYAELFQTEPTRFFPYHQLSRAPEPNYLIDVFVYRLESDGGGVEVAVTNGMSDQRMVEPGDSTLWARRELIQYFRHCTQGHARQLQTLAWVPLEEPFVLGFKDTVEWTRAAVEGTPWTDAFFLYPPIRAHDEFRMTLEGDPVNLLWHVPISRQERLFKVERGPNALIDRMDAVKLPWIFEESNRPALVE